MDIRCIYFVSLTVYLDPYKGNYDGLGKVREKELENAARVLSFDRFQILEDEELQDGPQEFWSPDYIVNRIIEYTSTHNTSGIISFDTQGISGHPNHISIGLALKLLKKNAKFAETKLYHLSTVNVFRKFIGPLDYLISSLDPYTFSSFNYLLSIRSMKAHKSQFVWFRWLFVVFSRYTCLNTLVPV